MERATTPANEPRAMPTTDSDLEFPLFDGLEEPIKDVDVIGEATDNVDVAVLVLIQVYL